MNGLTRLSVSTKFLLLTLTIAAIGIFSGAALLLAVSRQGMRDEMARSAVVLARAIGEYCVGPLVFDDRDAAGEILGELENNPAIQSARLYDVDGRVFARFQRAGTNPEGARRPRGHSHTWVVGPTLWVEVDVLHDRERIGSLIVAASTNDVELRLTRDTVLALVGCLLLLGVCGLLAARLQTLLTGPIVRLAATMRRITEGGRLDLRVEPPADDEMGTLYRGFNGMLDQVQERETERDRSEARLRALLRALPDVVFLVDAKGRYVDVMTHDPSLPVIPPTSLIGRTIPEVYPAETAARIGDAIAHTLRTGERRQFEYALDAPKGQRCFESVTTLVKAAPEEPMIVLVERDVTHRRRLEDQLRQSSKMDALGQLAGGIAHDFNNLLGGIIGFAEIIQRRPTSSAVPDHTEQILRASKRAADLVRQLLAFSRRTEQNFKPVDVTRLVDTVAEILRRTVDRRIDVVVDVVPCPLVRADEAQLESAILNLAVNARDAMPEGGTLTLRAAPAISRDSSASIPLDDDGPPTQIEVEVKDTGSGIPPEIQERIFEPFFTTKPTGQGTGLGLAAVYGTAKSHGGTISLQSRVGEGTTFRLTLPVKSGDDAHRFSPTQSVHVERGSGRVLFVEDEPLVSAPSSIFLRSLGYEVTVARDGQEGVDLFRENPTGYDLVIADMIMPRLTGRQVLNAVRAIRSDITVLLISGLIVGPGDGTGQQPDGFLHKPFEQAQLAAEVRRLTRKAISAEIVLS